MRIRAQKSKAIGITLKPKDLEDLDNYIKKQAKLINEGSELNRSLVIRKALRVLYKIDKPFDQITN